jgi:hypothetical protein
MRKIRLYSDKPPTKAHIMLNGYLILSAPTLNVLAPGFIFSLFTPILNTLFCIFYENLSCSTCTKNISLSNKPFFHKKLRDQQEKPGKINLVWGLC